MKFSDDDILSLKAVLYGCNANKKLQGSYYVLNPLEPEKTKEISFCKAIQNVMSMVKKLEGGDSDENT